MKPIHFKIRDSGVIISLLLVITLLSSFPAQATNSVKDLENKTNGLESELTDLNQELKALEKDLKEISSQVKKTSSELQQTRESLAIAIGKEEAQHESMMLRIKYMYENGNMSMVEMLLSSTCIADFVSRAEYIVQINNYDRKLLKEFTETREHVAEQEAKLQAHQEQLDSLQTELDKKESALKSKISNTSSYLSTYKAQLKKAKDEATKPIKPIVPSSNSSGNSSGSPSGNTNISHSASDVELLAALIECEAGSTNYEGMLAVGSVVVNRMNHSKYPNTLRGVVYQSGQFPPAHNGKLDRVLNRGVKASCVQAATDALAGKNNVGSCLSFRAASSGRPGTIIGSNVFF